MTHAIIFLIATTFIPHQLLFAQSTTPKPLESAKFSDLSPREANEIKEELLNQIKKEAPKNLEGVCGVHIVVDGEVGLGQSKDAKANFDRLFAHETWGCHENPQFGSHIADATVDKTIQKPDGREYQIVIRATGQWNFDKEPSTEIEGRVVDQNGLPIDGATIQARHPKTGQTYQMQTKDGVYVLKVPSYFNELSFEKDDCQKAEKEKPKKDAKGSCPPATLDTDKKEKKRFMKCSPVRETKTICSWNELLKTQKRIPKVRWDISAQCEPCEPSQISPSKECPVAETKPTEEKPQTKTWPHIPAGAGSCTLMGKDFYDNKMNTDCMSYAGSAFRKTDVAEDCKDKEIGGGTAMEIRGGIYSPSACSLSNVIGICELDADGKVEAKSFHVYYMGYTKVEGQSLSTVKSAGKLGCTTGGGIWYE